MTVDIEIRTLARDDAALMRAMLDLFAVAFDDVAHYASNRPDDTYLARSLSDPDFIAIVAMHRGEVVGGSASYVLNKFEQVRAEVYLYDIAVHADFRRRGIATALIRAVQKEGRARGADGLYVQADADDAPAVALYSTLGRRAQVLHFDIDDPREAG
ncbi:MAG: GNAT family N-acetyltransferase [Burkholderiaceae bacterium]